MIPQYSTSLESYIKKEQLPIWVEDISDRRHPEKRFHSHTFSELVFIVKGEGIHLLNESSAEIKAGDVLVIHEGATHAYDKTQNLGLINIVYDYKRLPIPILDGYTLPLFSIFFPKDNSDGNRDAAKPVMTVKAEEIETIFTMIKTLNQELRSFRPGSFYYSMALFMEITFQLARRSDYENKDRQSLFLIGNVINFMHNNFRKPLSMDTLANVANMSRRNFFRKFKGTVGVTPLEYLTRIRLDYATEMLLNSDTPISEIADCCGFYDSNYFCKKFKELKNKTPGQFRLSGRK